MDIIIKFHGDEVEKVKDSPYVEADVDKSSIKRKWVEKSLNSVELSNGEVY